MNDLAKEIEDMENLITANTDAPSTELPGTNAPITESVATEAPSTDAPTTEAPMDELATDSPSTDAPSTDAPTTDAPSEIDELKNEIKELRAMLKKPSSTEIPATSAPSTDAPISEENFLGELDLDDLTRDPDAFNKLLNSIYKKGVEAARAEVRLGNEGLMRSIPDIIRNNMQVTTALKKASDEFYTNNPDLKPFKKVVASVFEELASENPDKGYKDILADVEKETRKRLELHKKAVQDNPGNPPRLPRKKGKQKVIKPQPKTNSLQDELAEMDKVLDY